MEKISLTKIAPADIEGNFIRMIGKQWMLVTAGTGENYNTMTASWGAVGELWSRPVAMAFVRPQRYTFEFTESNDFYTLSFFGKDFRKELAMLGSVSGRDGDKVARSGLTPVETPSSVAFKEAVLVLECRKLYSAFLDGKAFTDMSVPESVYPEGDFHKMYVGEIVGAWQK